MSELRKDTKDYAQVVHEAWKEYQEKKLKIELQAAEDLEVDDVTFFLIDKQFIHVGIKTPRGGQQYHFTYEAIEFA